MVFKRFCLGIIGLKVSLLPIYSMPELGKQSREETDIAHTCPPVKRRRTDSLSQFKAVLQAAALAKSKNNSLKNPTHNSTYQKTLQQAPSPLLKPYPCKASH